MGTGLLSIGTRAMFANYAALQTTGNNISNANTPGYSRQTVELESAGGQFNGAGFFGKGVNVTTVSRAHNEFLTREAAGARSMAAYDEARSSQLQQLESVFVTGEQGLGYASGQFLNAFVDVANHPTDISARQVVLARATDLAAKFRTAGEQIDSLQSNVTTDLKGAITAVNTMAQRVADINRQIAANQGTGHEPNDLLDQRDQLISDIGSYVQVTTIPADDGSVSLFIGGGQRLVLGGQASTLAAVPDVYNPLAVHVGMVEASGTNALPDDIFSGGSMAGLLRFQNDDLADARNLLGQMAAALAGRVNEQQALGLDLSNPAASGAAIFSVGAPGVAPASSNAKDVAGNDVASYINGSGTRVSSVSLTITSVSDLQASDYELRNDPATPGAFQIKRLSDGQTTTINSGDVIDGFQVNVVAPLPAAGDRFLLSPVGSAALNMKRVLDDPKGIAAASPITASVGVNNSGTATVADVHATSTAINPQLTATLTFTSDTGDYSWELRDATTGVLASSGTATWQAGQPISLNGWQMTLNGVPKTGDSVVVQKTAFPSSNNGNA
ncbi:MAG TPA: flagellar hook-associated protein FlgK, partial [Albitalea sp.]|nr:flagellar hook-associated protein FlgK [Albitalea sp.]